MDIQLTIRLPAALARELGRQATHTGIKRSTLVRLALQRFLGLAPADDKGGLFERVTPLLGSIETGVADLGSAHETHLRQRLRRRRE